MDKTFTIIRKIHLYASFVILSFMLLYFVSGGVMILWNLFPRKNVNTVNEKVAVSGKTEADLLAEIRRQYNIQGKEIVKEQAGGNKSYSFLRPGHRAEITFRNGEDSVKVRVNEGNFASALNDFHRLHGYDGNWIQKIWAFMYDLSCIALLAFAVSGVYLWWRLEKKKRLGIIMLFASTGLTVFTIWYLMAVC